MNNIHDDFYKIAVAERNWERILNMRLQGELKVLTDALREISLCSQNSASSKEECGRIAREALMEVKETK